jgi:hypothetical protein
MLGSALSECARGRSHDPERQGPPPPPSQPAAGEQEPVRTARACLSDSLCGPVLPSRRTLRVVWQGAAAGPVGASAPADAHIVTAKFDFTAREGNEISFRVRSAATVATPTLTGAARVQAGDRIRVVSSDSSGWWVGVVTGPGDASVVGYFPAVYTDAEPG